MADKGSNSQKDEYKFTSVPSTFNGPLPSYKESGLYLFTSREDKKKTEKDEGNKDDMVSYNSTQ